MATYSYYHDLPPNYRLLADIASKGPNPQRQVDIDIANKGEVDEPTPANRPTVQAIRTRTRINTYSHVGSSSGSILCGICRKEFHPSRPEALIAHLAAHFDLRYYHHRCQRCEINFVCEVDLRRHLSSARRHRLCGYMFEHKQPCAGHHPPRRRRNSKHESEGRRRYSLMRQNDDARFDFCFRLRDWEQLQLHAIHWKKMAEPISGNVQILSQRTRWINMLQSCGLPFFQRCIRHTSLEPEGPIRRQQSSPILDEPLVQNADILGVMLLRAICTGNFKLVASLLFAKANIDLDDSFGFGSMHYAARYASPGVMRLLARAGPYVNKIDVTGMSPLCHAVKIGRSEIVQCLLELGAELRFHHLEYCVATGDTDTTEVLLDYWSKTDQSLDPLDILLLTATHNRDAHMVEALLTHGARALAKDQAGNTAMSIASSKGDKEIVQLLYGYGPEPDCWNKSRIKAMSEIVEYRHVAMVETLLSKGW